jgi:uncharacterized membrane-anchored protein YhcB (DUF1043 family)
VWVYVAWGEADYRLRFRYAREEVDERFQRQAVLVNHLPRRAREVQPQLAEGEVTLRTGQHGEDVPLDVQQVFIEARHLRGVAEAED